MSSYSSESSGVIRLGIPLELAPDVLPTALAKYDAGSPHTRVVPQHLSTAGNSSPYVAINSTWSGARTPVWMEFDGMLVAQESLGVLISSKLLPIGPPDGVLLDELTELRWVGFPRSASPAWLTN